MGIESSGFSFSGDGPPARTAIFGIKLAIPYLLGLGLLVGIPLLVAVALAFTDFSGVRAPRLVGLSNFRRMATDELFWQALRNSAVYVAIAVPLRLAAATALAVLLYRRSPGVGVGRAAAFLPTVAPEAALALLWLWMFNPLYGPLAMAASSLQLQTPNWLTDPTAARVGLAGISVFQIGEGLVLLLAVRRLTPAVFYEAAAVEAASPWFTFSRLTLPLMVPALVLLALRDFIIMLQLNFVPAMLITSGGPRNATTFLSLYVYQAGFRYFRFGYAAALSVAMLFITAIVILAQYRWLRRLQFNSF